MNMQNKWIAMPIATTIMMVFMTAGFAEEPDELAGQFDENATIFVDNQQEFEVEMEEARVRLRLCLEAELPLLRVGECAGIVTEPRRNVAREVAPELLDADRIGEQEGDAAPVLVHREQRQPDLFAGGGIDRALQVFHNLS